MVSMTSLGRCAIVVTSPRGGGGEGDSEKERERLADVLADTDGVDGGRNEARRGCGWKSAGAWEVEAEGK